MLYFDTKSVMHHDVIGSWDHGGINLGILDGRSRVPTVNLIGLAENKVLNVWCER